LRHFFESARLRAVKEHIVETGLRMWRRSLVDGNGGNITVRVGDNLALCTPTLVSKGCLRADDIALVDLDGVQLAGLRKRTSEVNTHLACMKATAAARACIHAHPAHATAFAVAHLTPPSAMCSEAEVFLGEIALAPYATPGSPENARLVGALAAEHPAILLANHGVMVWGGDLETAYWRLENLEAACRTLWIASQLGSGLHPIPPAQMRELVRLRAAMGMDDKRRDFSDSALCHSQMSPGFKGLVASGESALYRENARNVAADEGACPNALHPADIEAVARRVADLLGRK
jgi:L-fuculose-phosphate aldolase